MKQPSRVIRVFPSKTKATPDDELAFVACAPTMFAEADRVEISVTFTWDKRFAEEFLYTQWKHVAPTYVGGPAYGASGDVFVPGVYLRPGYTMTSRGCNNRCRHCLVHDREGGIRELPVMDGWNVLDSNLLQCSEAHIREVFAMLKRQEKRAEFTGGLEARLLKPWHVELLRDLRPKQMFFAYDRESEYEYLVRAGQMLVDAGFTVASHVMRCYVLVGFGGDTFDLAISRIMKAWMAGFWPMAMLYRGPDQQLEDRDPEWVHFQSQWTNPMKLHHNIQLQIEESGGL